MARSAMLPDSAEQDKRNGKEKSNAPANRRRWLILAVAYTHVLLTSGVVFGWAALETFYMDLTPQARNLIFTVAASINYLSNLFFGPYLDSRGARRCSGLACTLMIFGALGMCFADSSQIVASGWRMPLLGTSFALLGFAGPGVQMPTLRCELLFPERSSLVTSLNASIFDASCVVFLVFKLLSMWIGLNADVLFGGYAVTLLACLVTGQVLFGDLDDAARLSVAAQFMARDGSPWSSPSPCLMNGFATPVSRSGPSSPTDNRAVRMPRSTGSEPLLKTDCDDVEPQLVPEAQDFQEVVRSPRFFYLICFCAVGILRLNFVVLSINAQMLSLFEKSRAADLVIIFSALLPMGGLAAPLTAYLLGNHQRWAYRVNLGLSFVYGLCLIAPYEPAQLLGFVIISVSRQLTYSIVFSLTLSFFGQQNLGKLLAVNNAMVFTVSLLQYPIASAVGGPWVSSWCSADLIMVAIAIPLLSSNGGL